MNSDSQQHGGASLPASHGSAMTCPPTMPTDDEVRLWMSRSRPVSGDWVDQALYRFCYHRMFGELRDRSPNAGTQRPGTPDGSLATDAQSRRSLE